MTVPLEGFGFQVWFIGTGVECRPFDAAGSGTSSSTFSNRGI